MENKNNIQIFLLVLLVLSAFYIGSLQSRVRKLQEKVDGGSVITESEVAGTTNTVETGTTGSVFNPSQLTSLAEQLGVDKDAFETCLISDQATQRVQSEEKSGTDAGVQGTPGNFLLDTQTGLAVFIPGAYPYEDIVGFYDKLLAGEGTVIAGLPGLSNEDFVRGDRNSRVLLIEYSDYDCSFCQSFHVTAQQMIENYAGQVAWIYRQMPLDGLHPDARIKSIGAICVGQLGGNDAFWSYSDAFLMN